MRRIAILLLPIALTGCATASEPKAPAPVVEVAGPKFTPGQFDCGTDPLPPNPAGAVSGKTGAVYDNTLRAYGRGCRAKLESVGAALAGAGQVQGAE